MMKKVLMTVLTALALAGNASAWETISGQNCGVSDPKMVAVYDFESLAKLWAKTYQGTPKALDLPSVDFTKETVVAVFLGEKPTQGYGVDLSLQQDPMDPSRLYVLYKELVPKTNAFKPQVVSRPFVIRKIPKAYKQVIFEANQSVRALPPAITIEKSDRLAGIIFKVQQAADQGF